MTTKFIRNFLLTTAALGASSAMAVTDYTAIANGSTESIAFFEQYENTTNAVTGQNLIFEPDTTASYAVAEFQDGAGGDITLTGSTFTNTTLRSIGTTGGGGNITITGATAFSQTTAQPYISKAAGSGTLTFSSAPTFTGSGYIEVLSNLTMTIGNGLDITSPIQISSGRTLTVSVGNGNSATLSGIISGAGGLTFTGGNSASILTLSGANTYTGATAVTEGILNISGQNLNSTSGIAVTAAKTLRFTGTAGSSAPISLGAASIIDVANSATATISGTITPAAAAALTLGTSATATLSANLALAGTLTATVGASSTATISGVVSGAQVITKAGAGTLALTGENTYSGGTNLNAGTLSLGNDAGAGTGTITVGANATLTPTTSANIANAISIGGAVTLTINPGSGISTILSGTISDAANDGVITKSGSGTLTLSGTNTYGGGTNINAGNVKVLSAGALGNAGTVTINAATTLGFLSSVTIARDIAMNANLTINADAGITGTLSGVISGTGYSVTKTGTGSIILSGNNTYTGGTSVSNGALTLGHANAHGTGTIAISAGKTLVIDHATSRTIAPSAVTPVELS